VRRAYGGDLRPWGEDEGVVEGLVRGLVREYVKVGEREKWVERIGEGDAHCVASLLLRALPGVGRMLFPGFELVDPGFGGEGGRGGREMG